MTSPLWRGTRRFQCISENDRTCQMFLVAFRVISPTTVCETSSIWALQSSCVTVSSLLLFQTWVQCKPAWQTLYTLVLGSWLGLSTQMFKSLMIAKLIRPWFEQIQYIFGYLLLYIFSFVIWEGSRGLESVDAVNVLMWHSVVHLQTSENRGSERLIDCWIMLVLYLQSNIMWCKCLVAHAYPSRFLCYESARLFMLLNQDRLTFQHIIHCKLWLNVYKSWLIHLS